MLQRNMRLASLAGALECSRKEARADCAGVLWQRAAAVIHP